MSKISTPRCIAALVAIIFFDASVQRTVASGGLRTIVLSGEQLPGAEPGILFAGFAAPTVTHRGDVGFLASQFASPVAHRLSASLVVSRGSNLAVTVVDGEPVPRAPDNATFQQYLFRQFTEIDEFFFTASLQGPGIGRDGGLYKLDAMGNLSAVAVGGDPILNAPSGSTYSNLNYRFSIAVNDRGEVASKGLGVAPDGSTFEAILAIQDGGVFTIAREGDQHSGGVISGTLPFTNGGLLLNNNGSVVFRANSNQSPAIFLKQDGGELEIVALTGQDAPDVEPDILISSLGRELSLNDAGTIVFDALLEGPAIMPGAEKALYRRDASGRVAVVTRSGGPAPGVFDGAITDFRDTVVNEKGAIATVAEITGPDVTFNDDDALYVFGEEGDANLLLRKGDPAPGLPEVTFERLSIGVFNGRGQIASLVHLDGPDINPGNDEAIYVFQPGLDPILVARQGGMLDVSDDPENPDIRVIQTLQIADAPHPNHTNNEDGRQSWFNDRGQLAFVATFTDNTRGIFVSNHVAVPEPASLALLSLLSLVALSLSRFRR